MKKILFSIFVLTAMTATASLKDLNNLRTPFKLPKLPYAANSLEVAIDEATMNTHYGKHHQAYVDNANKAIDKRRVKMIDLLKDISKHPTAVRNNVGGHWNHSFFWTVLSPKEADNVMPEDLKKEIEAKWESVEKFQEAFEKAGAGQFGSGWAWLIQTTEGLKITTTANQDNPLMDVAAEKGWPVLGADVWEHAYYLKYKNNRADYLKNFWKVVNWKQVDKYNKEAKKLIK